MKAALKAPSAKIARKLFGSRSATKNASAIGAGAENRGEHDVARKAGQPRKERIAADGENTTEHAPLLAHAAALQNGEIRLKARRAQP